MFFCGWKDPKFLGARNWSTLWPRDLDTIRKKERAVGEDNDSVVHIGKCLVWLKYTVYISRYPGTTHITCLEDDVSFYFGISWTFLLASKYVFWILSSCLIKWNFRGKVVLKTSDWLFGTVDEGNLAALGWMTLSTLFWQLWAMRCELGTTPPSRIPVAHEDF